MHVTGVESISSFGNLAAGARRIVMASGAFTLAHGANLLLPNAGNDILADVGDTFTVVGEGAGVSRVVAYQRADGTALVSAISGVFGNVGSNDNRLLRSNGISGSAIQGSGIVVDDTNNMTGLANVS